MVEFKFFEPLETVGNVKATVQKSGKLGFSKGAIKVLELDKEPKRFFKIAANAEDTDDKSLYLVRAEESDENVFQAKKAGEYYYLNIRHILNQLGIDYRNDNNIIYDIIKKKTEELDYYHLNRRKPASRTKK